MGTQALPILRFSPSSFQRSRGEATVKCHAPLRAPRPQVSAANEREKILINQTPQRLFTAMGYFFEGIK